MMHFLYYVDLSLLSMNVLHFRYWVHGKLVLFGITYLGIIGKVGIIYLIFLDISGKTFA